MLQLFHVAYNAVTPGNLLFELVDFLQNVLGFCVLAFGFERLVAVLFQSFLIVVQAALERSQKHLFLVYALLKSFDVGLNPLALHGTLVFAPLFFRLETPHPLDDPGDMISHLVNVQRFTVSCVPTVNSFA